MAKRITTMDVLDITNLTVEEVARLWPYLTNEERRFLISKLASIPEAIRYCNYLALVCWTTWEFVNNFTFIDYDGIGATYDVDDTAVTVNIPAATTAVPTPHAGFYFKLPYSNCKRAYVLSYVEIDDTIRVDTDFADTTDTSYANPPDFYICPRITSAVTAGFQILKNVAGTETQLIYENVTLATGIKYKVEGYASVKGQLVAYRDDTDRLRTEAQDPAIDKFQAVRITGWHDDTKNAHTFKIYPPILVLIQT